MKTMEEFYEALKRMPQLVMTDRGWGPAENNDHDTVTELEVIDAIEAVEELHSILKGKERHHMTTMEERLDEAEEGLTQDLVRAMEAWSKAPALADGSIPMGIDPATLLKTALIIRSRAEERDYAADRERLEAARVVEFEDDEVTPELAEKIAKIKKAYMGSAKLPSRVTHKEHDAFVRALKVKP